MKQVFLIFCGALLLAAVAGCNSAQSDAEKQAALIQKTIKENSPGTIPTSSTGYYMKAKIDGKDWSASYMMPYEDISSSYIYITGENEGDNISFQLWKQGLSVGKKLPFSEDDAANIMLKNVSGYLGGRSGFVEITKMDGKWMEGTFQISANSVNSPDKAEITDGHFRVAMQPGLR